MKEASDRALADFSTPCDSAVGAEDDGISASRSDRERFLVGEAEALGSCARRPLRMQMRQALLLGLSFNLYRLRYRYLFRRMSTEPSYCETLHRTIMKHAI